MPTLITPDSPLSLEQVSVDTWVSFERSQPLQVGQFSMIANSKSLPESGTPEIPSFPTMNPCSSRV
ncbi:hypothetical protein PEC18_07450 [Paucibacter sp. O1-1]|nr:hypothetical protein [Paucibacter sp. O1-1]MDA3825706.1 hypothetical protein [Paucibacter sp. O1-1]